MMALIGRLVLGLACSAGIGFLAFRREALDFSGAVGAAVAGTLIFGLGGWIWGALLITFFLLSTLLSKYKARTKASLAEKFAKGSRRDLGQVLANGGAGIVLAILYAWMAHPVLLFAFGGAMATVNADTWATELGVLSRRPPRLITSGEVVEPGTSGGISLVGTLATGVGGLVIGGAALAYLWLDGAFGGGGAALAGGSTMLPALVAATAVGGLGGSFFDSLLGATVQAIYYTRRRSKETERPIEPDGTPNQLLRGWRWLNNDWVNFLSSLVGAGLGSLVYLVAH